MEAEGKRQKRGVTGGNTETYGLLEERLFERAAGADRNLLNRGSEL